LGRWTWEQTVGRATGRSIADDANLKPLKCPCFRLNRPGSVGLVGASAILWIFFYFDILINI
jgi:hypothetical protein